MKETLANRIVERGASSRGNGCKRRLKIFGIARKCLSTHEFNRNVVVKVHDEHFVLGIARMCEEFNRRDYVRELAAHTSAVVNDKSDGNGSISLFEYGEVLRLSVFKHAKFFPLQARDKTSARVSHIDGKQHEAGVDCNFLLALPGNGRLCRKRGREAENTQ